MSTEDNEQQIIDERKAKHRLQSNIRMKAWWVKITQEEKEEPNRKKEKATVGKNILLIMRMRIV